MHLTNYKIKIWIRCV